MNPIQIFLIAFLFARLGNACGRVREPEALQQATQEQIEDTKSDDNK